MSDDQEALVTVGFTPEQADDATSGDIDRNGAASMLSGIIEALEERIGVASHSDDDLVEMGVRHVESMRERGGVFAGPHDGGFGSRPQIGLTALKLLARLRDAEAKIYALTQARHDDAQSHSQELADLAEHVLAEPSTLPPEDLAKLREAVDQLNRAAVVMEPVAARLNTNLLTARDIAVAIVDHVDKHGWDGPANGHAKPFDERMREASYTAADAMRAGRARAVARLTEVIKGVVHRDAEPENLTRSEMETALAHTRAELRGLAKAHPSTAQAAKRALDLSAWPLWCAMETDPRSEHAFHGPFETKDAAEAEAAAQTVEADHPEHEIVARRCRPVLVTDALVRWAAEQLVDHVNENPLELADADGLTCYGNWESEIASLRECLDQRVQLKLWVVEPRVEP